MILLLLHIRVKYVMFAVNVVDSFNNKQHYTSLRFSVTCCQYCNKLCTRLFLISLEDADDVSSEVPVDEASV